MNIPKNQARPDYINFTGFDTPIAPTLLTLTEVDTEA